MPYFVAGFKPSDREMLQYQLGSINDYDRPSKPKGLFDGAFYHYMTGVSMDTRRKERQEVQNTNAAKIRSYAPSIEFYMKNAYVCTFGSDAKITESKGIFDRIVRL